VIKNIRGMSVMVTCQVMPMGWVEVAKSYCQGMVVTVSKTPKYYVLKTVLAVVSPAKRQIMSRILALCGQGGRNWEAAAKMGQYLG